MEVESRPDVVGRRKVVRIVSSYVECRVVKL